VHQQSAGFTRLPPWDFEASREKYPLLLHAPYFDLYRRQVIKQADLLLAQYWFGDRFDDENKARNVDYYERRTVRDSSLSAAVQAVTAAEVGHLELAYDYVYEAAQIDLRDLDHNSGDGMHIASLASVWTALVAGFGGLREYQGQLSFAPQLPDLITRLSFTVQWRGQRLEVDIEPGPGDLWVARQDRLRVVAFRHHGGRGHGGRRKARHRAYQQAASTATPPAATARPGTLA